MGFALLFSFYFSRPLHTSGWVSLSLILASLGFKSACWVTMTSSHVIPLYVVVRGIEYNIPIFNNGMDKTQVTDFESISRPAVLKSF